jgi:uncharacterized HAD superfamily protein
MTLLYRSYSDLHNDLTHWSKKLPPVSAICGVPRSGVIVASQLAQILHKPLVPMEYLCNPGLKVFRAKASRRLNVSEKPLPVLLLDDTCSSGITRVEVEAYLAKHSKVPHIYGCVYARPNAVKRFPGLLHGYALPERYHTFQWNLLMSPGITETLAVDMDGILCYDWVGGANEEDGRYEQWILNAPPLRLPVQPVKAIFTNRLEKWRPQTIEWLKKNGVRYTHLEMYPGTREERSRNWSAHKIRMFRKHRMAVSGFIESDYRQAAEIAKATGFSTIHMESGTAWNCKSLRPPIILPQAQRSSQTPILQN